jgi:hypothetical protein
MAYRPVLHDHGKHDPPRDPDEDDEDEEEERNDEPPDVREPDEA